MTEPRKKPDHKKPGPVVWMSLVFVSVCILYPLSSGPALWLAKRHYIGASTFGVLYGPLNVVVQHSPEPIPSLFHEWGKLWYRR